MGQFTMPISGPQKITKIYTGTHISRHSSTTVYQDQYCDQTKLTVGIVDQTSIPLLGSAGNVQE